jgi:hypothetical protein
LTTSPAIAPAAGCLRTRRSCTCADDVFEAMSTVRLRCSRRAAYVGRQRQGGGFGCCWGRGPVRGCATGQRHKTISITRGCMPSLLESTQCPI